MKNITAITLCTMLVMSLAACGASRQDGDERKSRPVSTEEKSSTNTANPFVTYDTLEEAEKAAGFEIETLDEVLEGYERKEVRVIENELSEIIYENKEAQIRFRKAKGSEDISGDYNKYEESNVIKLGDLEVTIKGNQGNAKIAVWTNGDYSYAITVSGDKGIENSTINKIIKKMTK